MKKLLSLTFSVAVLLCCLSLPGVVAESDVVDEGLVAKPFGEIKYLSSEALVTGVSPNTTATDVAKAFENSANVYVCDKDGYVITSELVGTGSTVNYKAEGVKQSADVVIYGDVNGDGKISSVDALQIKRNILSLQNFNELQKEASNVSGDTSVNSLDVLLVKRGILNLQVIRNSAHYFVSKNGSDSGDGSESNPYKTIQKAASVMSAGDTCFIDSGVYRETVIPKNEGEKGAPITFTAKEGADVTVSGTDTANLTWSLYKDGIYKTSINLFRDSENQIFVNGEMAKVARYPNNTSDNFIAVGEKLTAATAGDTFATSAEINGKDFTGAEIAIEGTSHYLYYSSTVTSHQGNKVVFNKLDSGWDSPTTNSYFYFYNKLSLLDAENEYFYDGSTLYYKPKAGVDLSKATVEFSARSQAFNVENRSYITVDGITIFGARPVTNDGSDHFTLSNNKILYYYHTTKTRHYPWQAWFFGVELWGDYSKVENCEIAYGAEGGVEVHGDNCSVVNNYIHDINYINSNAAAVENYNCDFTLVSHNTIDNVARSGIILACANMRVCYNEITNCAINTQDVSSIGSYKTDAMGTVEVDHNIVHDTNSVAYYLDNGSLNYIVHHNLCYNIQSAMIMNNPSYGNKIYNNTLICDNPINTGNLENPYDNNSFVGAVWHGDQFYNNILPSVFYGEGVMCANNLFYKDKGVNFTNTETHDYTLKSTSNAINKGLMLPIGCETYSGSAPDIGAFEYGETPWTVGHDFSKTFDSKFVLSRKYSGFSAIYDKMYIEGEQGSNVLTNGNFSNGLTGWENIGATVTNGEVKLKAGWINQSFAASEGQVYRFSGKVRGYDVSDSFIEFGIHFMNGDNIISQGAFMVTNDKNINRQTLVCVPKGCNKIRFFVATWGDKITAYVDDLELVLMK